MRKKLPCDSQVVIYLVLLDPFGYDKNDLNLDHFTHNIIRQLA